VDDQFVTEPKKFAVSFANHFKSIFDTSCQTVTPTYSVMTDFLPTVPVSASELRKATNCLKPSKCVGLDDIPSFIVKGFSDIFIRLLTYIFNLSVASETFPSLWKETAAVPVFKKGISTVVSNYTPISVLNKSSKTFKFIIYGHFYIIFKYRLNPSQHGFYKHNSTSISLVTYLNTVVLYVSKQGKTDTTLFVLSNAFDIVPIIFFFLSLLTLDFPQVISIVFTLSDQ
jgi:hypothetical protein